MSLNPSWFENYSTQFNSRRPRRPYSVLLIRKRRFLLWNWSFPPGNESGDNKKMLFNFTSRLLVFWNRMSLWLGIFVSLGLSLIGNFQLETAAKVPKNQASQGNGYGCRRSSIENAYEISFSKVEVNRIVKLGLTITNKAYNL